MPSKYFEVNYSIGPLAPNADTASFDCGENALNAYLQRYASQDIKRGVARVFAATSAGLPQEVAGFYTLSAASIVAETLPETLRKKLPRYPVPVAMLRRLAVSVKAQGQGLGSILLADACKRVVAASKTLAVSAIVVDTKPVQAAAFYKHFGFIELPGQPGRWLLQRSRFAPPAS